MGIARATITATMTISQRSAYPITGKSAHN
jgi:hypothetical protein